ncbi:MAG TPA: lipoprotein [Steroidobacteraceae bacterium]|nr:lipoprotein [Steroidobacteraceae bacterium]
MRALTVMLLGTGLALVLAGCGQRGPLYIPDRNARVVTRPASASAPASAPSSAPPTAEPR